VTLLSLSENERAIATIPLACKGPFGLSFTSHRDWLYVACWDQAKIALIDVTARRPTQIFNSGKWPAWIEARNHSNETWISDEAKGIVSIYRSGTSVVLSTISTGPGTSDIVFNRNGTRSWVSNETAGTVSWIDARRHRKIRDIQVGAVPQGMTLTSNEESLLVANYGSDSVSIIDVESGAELAVSPVCKGPVDLTSVKVKNREIAFVTCYAAGTIIALDLQSRQILSTLQVGDHPFGIEADVRRGNLYVCVGGSGKLLVLRAAPTLSILRSISLGGNPLRLALSR